MRSRLLETDVTGKREFEDKVVAVTGAAGGIGQALCRHFGAVGAAIAALDRSETVMDFADELTSEGMLAQAAVADIADADAVQFAFAELTLRLGAVHVLVNNAGVSTNPSLARTGPEGWRADVDANLNGAFNCCHAVLEGMKSQGGGSIVNIGSVNGLSALGDAAYSAAKAGMISLTRSLALEFGRYNIRANIVCPGTVRTPIWDERAARNPEVLEQLQRWYPLGRIVEPIEVARAVAFLASDAASAITGAVLPVDCGLSAGNLVMARELTVEEL
jgi:NAD(P)-dependent dehydrogenase (short-subunit alcohol dehydrogenase family)